MYARVCMCVRVRVRLCFCYLCVVKKCDFCMCLNSLFERNSSCNSKVLFWVYMALSSVHGALKYKALARVYFLLMQCVAVCCSVLQCVAVCCSVLQFVQKCRVCTHLVMELCLF